MELFDTRLANAYIWACSEKKDRSFPPKQVFRGTQEPSFDKLAIDHNQIGDYPIGLGRYIMHLGAYEAYNAAIGAAYR